MHSTDPARERMISIENVTCRYAGSAHAALSGFSLEVPKGAFVALLGGGASGKTTVMRLLTGELKPQTGSVVLASNDIARLSAGELQRYRRTIGLVSADHRLLEDRTVEENILLPLEISGSDRKRGRQRVEEVLRRFRLLEKRDLFPRSLSMSERQRTAIARAVVGEPYVLLADEPTLHLNAEAARDILALLRDEHLRGMTLLLATSDESVLADIPEAEIVTLSAAERSLV